MEVKVKSFKFVHGKWIESRSYSSLSGTTAWVSHAAHKRTIVLVVFISTVFMSVVVGLLVKLRD